MQRIDLKDKTFGYLTVLPRHKRKLRLTYWLCSCVCSKSIWVASYNLRKGKTKSCGCKTIQLFKETAGTHRKSSHWLYHRWKDIRTRCLNKNCKSYPLYGGRGITICEEWRWGFQSFFTYIENTIGLHQEKSLDRIDPDKGYEPGNIRWATKSEQLWNLRPKKRKYKGVFPEKNGSFKAQIACKGKVYYLGLYSTQEDAALAYNKAAVSLHGSFSHLNKLS